MPVCFSYLRCSHIDSAESGLGLEAQEQDILTYHRRTATVRQLKLILPPFADIAISAWKNPFLKRKAGYALDQALERGDHVICARHDRMFRSLRDMANVLANWRERGVEVHFANLGFDTSTPTGKLTLNILMAVAEWDSDLKSLVTKQALAIREINGLSPGGGRGTAGQPVGFEVRVRYDPTQDRDRPYLEPLLPELRLWWLAVQAIRQLQGRFGKGKIQHELVPLWLGPEPPEESERHPIWKRLELTWCRSRTIYSPRRRGDALARWERRRTHPFWGELFRRVEVENEQDIWRDWPRPESDGTIREAGESTGQSPAD
jgi:DNA invertase Pin-like site-specific DNA recombinase